MAEARLAPAARKQITPAVDAWSAPEVRNALAALPRLIAAWPDEIAELAGSGRERLLAKLRKALRAERQRGLAGHWTYDLARHAELLAVYRLLARTHATSTGKTTNGTP